jgi:D-lactate dehydrogenase
MRIVVFEVMPGEKEALLAHLPRGHEIIFTEEKLTPEKVDLARGAQIISVFVKSEVRAEMFVQLPDLKLITTRSMGFDHINIAAAKASGVLVNNVRTYASHPVAEFTFALLLNVMRKIYHAYDRLRSGTNFDIRGLSGFNLYGKTIGVVGTGRIGANVCTIAKGFGMQVLAFDAFPNAELAARIGFTYASLDELLMRSDIVTVHVPHSKETHHLIDSSKFARMKKGVVFINTARGEIVDTHALVAALRDGTVWGAGLDVLEEERAFAEEGAAVSANTPGIDYALLTANHVLIDLPNVIVTPHIAFETAEAMQEISRVTAETISNFIAGTEQPYL